MLLWGILVGFLFFLFYVFEMLVALAILFVIIGGLMTTVYFNQNKLLYMPVIPDMALSPSQNPFRYRHPSQQGLKADDLELKTEDGLTIRGWHVKRQGAKQVIIYFHENAGNIGFRIPLLRQLSTRTESEVILVAYRGYSDSQGLPSEEGLQKDAEAIIKYAIEYCESKDPNLDLFLYGRSLGGAVSVYLASHEQFKSKIKGVILENTFTSISDMIDAIMPIFKYLKFLQTNHWRSIERIPKIEKPILFIRSLRDEIVPTGQMVRLFENVDQGLHVQQYIIETGTHNTSWQIERDIYFGKINEFIEHPKVRSKESKQLNEQIEETIKRGQNQQKFTAEEQGLL